MNEPLVSVITNSYNTARYIGPNIASILAQEYSNWEHVVVDCGSIDGSLDNIRLMAHARMRLVEVPFCGVSESRNTGIHQCAGEFVAILDSDDIAFPSRLRLQAEVLSANANVVGVGSGMVSIDAASGKRKVHRYPAENDMILTLAGVGINPIPHSSLMFRRSAYMRLGGYSSDIQKSEDFDLILRLSGLGTLRSISAPLVACARRLDSHTFTHRPNGRDEFYYAILSLIANGIPTADARLRECIGHQLDGLGQHSPRALVGRWALGALLLKLFSLDRESASLLAKTVISQLPHIMASRKQAWWVDCSSPQRIIQRMRRLCAEPGEECRRSGC